MFALALVAALAWAPAQAPPTLAERLGLEGPLDNDTDLARNAEALAELLAGDKAIAQSIDETTKVNAFEHWRRALIVSDPLDAVAVDERRSISVAQAVENRLGTALRRDFRERFEGVAAAALAAAGTSERALTRVAYENPFTRSGLLAELRLHDAAFERYEISNANAALKRLQASDELGDAGITRAVAARHALAQGNAWTIHQPTLFIPSGKSLLLERTIELGTIARSDSDRMLEAGCALAFDRQTVWVQSGDSLVSLAPDGKHAHFELAKIVGASALHATWVPGFGDKDRAWVQRPSLYGSMLSLVLGRALEQRGNAIAVFDVATGVPQLRWIHHDGERPEVAPLSGRLEYQPGPVASDGLLIAQVLQWDQSGVSVDQQRVDGRNTHAWLVAFDLYEGTLVWKRRLASGADRRGRALDRFDNARATSVASLPLVVVGPEREEIAVATELGVAARVSSHDGRLVESNALKRVRHNPDIRPGSGGPFVSITACRAVVAPSDSDEFVYFLGSDPYITFDRELLSVIRLPGLDQLVGHHPLALVALVHVEGRSVLQGVGLLDDTRWNSLPLPRGADWKGGSVEGAHVAIAAGGSLMLFDLRLTLLAELVLEGLENENHVGVWTHESKVYVAGQGRIWVVRLE